MKHAESFDRPGLAALLAACVLSAPALGAGPSTAGAQCPGPSTNLVFNPDFRIPLPWARPLRAELADGQDTNAHTTSFGNPAPGSLIGTLGGTGGLRGGAAQCLSFFGVAPSCLVDVVASIDVREQPFGTQGSTGFNCGFRIAGYANADCIGAATVFQDLPTQGPPTSLNAWATLTATATVSQAIRSSAGVDLQLFCTGPNIFFGNTPAIDNPSLRSSDSGRLFADGFESGGGSPSTCSSSPLVLAQGLQNSTFVAVDSPWLYVSTEGPLGASGSACFQRQSELFRVPLSGGPREPLLLGSAGAAKPLLLGAKGVLPSSACTGGQAYRIDGAAGFVVPASGLQDSRSMALDSQFLYAGDPNFSGVVLRGLLGVAPPTPFSTRNAVNSSPRHMQASGGHLYFVGQSADEYQLFLQATSTPGVAPDVMVTGIPGVVAATPPLIVVDGSDVFIASRLTSGYELRRAATSARDIAFSALPLLRSISATGFGSASVSMLDTDAGFIYVRERDTIVRVPRAGGTAVSWQLAEAGKTPTDFAIADSCLTYVMTEGPSTARTSAIKRVSVSAAFPP